MKRLIALLLLLLLPVAAFAEELTPEEAYTEYVELLDLYMQAGAEEQVYIEKLIEGFESLRTYKSSVEYLMYAQVMHCLAQDDFFRAESWLSILAFYPDFAAMLEEEDYPYSCIGSLGEMQLYLSARKAEAEGDMSAASENYSRCLTFYDSMLRFTALDSSLEEMFVQAVQSYSWGDYENAMRTAEFLLKHGYAQAQPLYDMARDALGEERSPAATPAPEATPVAVQHMQLKGFYNGTSAAMSWDAVPGADGYRLYRSRGRQGEMVLIAEQEKAGYYDRNCYVGIYNGYIVEALQGDVVIARSQQTDVYCVAEKKTSAPTAAPVVTQPPAHNPDNEVTFAPNHNDSVGFDQNENGDYVTDEELPAKATPTTRPDVEHSDNNYTDNPWD